MHFTCTYMTREKIVEHEANRKIWGQSVTKYTDIAKVFVDYITGKIKKMPFSPDPLGAESTHILETLIACCKNKLLTVNS